MFLHKRMYTLPRKKERDRATIAINVSFSVETGSIDYLSGKPIYNPKDDAYFVSSDVVRCPFVVVLGIYLSTSFPNLLLETWAPHLLTAFLLHSPLLRP